MTEENFDGIKGFILPLAIVAVIIAVIYFVLLREQPQEIGEAVTISAGQKTERSAAGTEYREDVLDKTNIINEEKSMETENKQKMFAVIETQKGNIKIELYLGDAPKTAANFVEKANSDFYKGLNFHRVEDWVVQGGDPVGNGTGGGNISTELNKKPFVVGSVGAARGGDIEISNDAQFFITKTDASWLNEQYSNFGMVIEGMDVVNNLAIGDQILKIGVLEN